MEGESLEPQIREAQKALEVALDDACAADFDDIDTGELIRVEESLAVASKAAKQAVSLRLRRRNQRAKKAAEPVGESSIAAHRIFDDIRGKRWRAFAVHPSSASVQLAALPESYRQGWLTFESGDSVRRVAPIPDRWEDLTIEDLRLLCHRAGTTPKGTVVIEAHRYRKPNAES